MKSIKYLLIMLLAVASVTYASVKRIGYALETAVIAPADFSKEIDTKLPKQFKDLAFNVLMTCTKNGHPKHQGSANIRCVALDAVPIEIKSKQ